MTSYRAKALCLCFSALVAAPASAQLFLGSLFSGVAIPSASSTSTPSGDYKSCFAFDVKTSPQPSVSTQKVFAHYLSPFPISLDNQPPSNDYYTNNYLNPNGEGGRYRYAGGYIKERPLPQNPRAVNVDFQKENFKLEIRRAAAIGIDGFTFDMLGRGAGNVHWDALKKMMVAATEENPAFKIVLMPDMFAAYSMVSATDMASDMVELSLSSAAYRTPDGRLVIAPYYADNRDLTFWSDFVRAMAGQGVPVVLWPVFVNDWVKATDSFTAQIPLYGTSSWGFRTASGASAAAVWPDQAHARQLKWMAPVNAQDSRPQALIYSEPSQTSTLRTMWDTAISKKAEAVQLITWNDYAESTETSPSSNTGWALFDLNAYYINWFKTGTKPRVVRDVVYYFHRTQSVNANPLVVSQPVRYTAVNGAPGEDYIEAIALLTAPATVQITIGSVSRQMNGVAGVNTFRIPLVEGTPAFKVVRNGQTVASVTGAAISNNIQYQDLLYRAGSSAVCNRTPLLGP